MKIPLKYLGLVIHTKKQLENDKNFKKHIAKIENVLKLWRSRTLSLEGIIKVFKSLALSKITHLALNTSLHKRSIKQNTKEFYLERAKP